MSCYAFGTIKLIGDISGGILPSIAWKIMKAGIECSLFIIFSPNLVQDEIEDMLNKQSRHNDPYLRFMVTDSPISNTSHELICCPDYVQEEYANEVSRNLSLIADWIKVTLGHKEVLEVDLYITEGYDTSFKEVRAIPDDLYRKIMNEVDVNGMIPESIVVRAWREDLV